MRNSTISMFAGLMAGLIIGSLFGFSVIKPVFIEFQLDLNAMVSLLGTALGAVITIFASVFIGGWKDRHAATAAAVAAIAACDFALCALKSKSSISGSEHNFDATLCEAARDIRSAHNVIAMAANGGGLKPDCVRAGFWAMDAIS